MEIPSSACEKDNCSDHYHLNDPVFQGNDSRQQSQAPLVQRRTADSQPNLSKAESDDLEREGGAKLTKVVSHEYDPDDHGFRRIIRNFTPS